jgi:hypothetical protein
VTHALADGSFLVEPPETLPNTPGGPRSGTLIVLRLSADGTRVDTVGKFVSSRLTFDAGAPKRIRHLHLTGPFSYVAIDDRIYGGNGEENSLQSVAIDGRTLGTVQLSQPRIPVTRQLRQAFEDSLRASYARNPRMYEGPVESYLAGDFPDVLPAYMFVQADQSGNLWLASGRNPLRPSGPEYRIYSRTVTPLGVISFPPRVAPVWLGRDEVIVVELDDSDVEYIRLYRLVRS